MTTQLASTTHLPDAADNALPLRWERLLALSGVAFALDYAGVQAAVREWQPFAGLVYFHLLLANLAEHGILSESSRG